MPGKPMKVTGDRFERAQRLVDAGHKPKDATAHSGVTKVQLNHYGVRLRPAPVKGRRLRGADERGEGRALAPCRPFARVLPVVRATLRPSPVTPF